MATEPVARPNGASGSVADAYRARIASLRDGAPADDIVVNDASERDFWAFVRSSPGMDRAELSLLENGNLRAVWKGADGSHLGLQFRGDGTVAFVVFTKRAGAAEASRAYGTDTLEGVRGQVGAFDLPLTAGA